MSDAYKKCKGVWDTFAACVGFLINDVVKEFGDKGWEVASNACRKAGFLLARDFIESNKIKELGTESFGKLYLNIGGVSDFGVEVPVLTEKKCVLKAHFCPYIDVWKKGNISRKDICDILCKADEGAAQAFNPKLKLTLTKTLTQGDSYCEYVFEE
ncbi:MAG: L-2-amino-thiazoline-4-carboxylic acid hydrolase [Candidatus Bathyarchaeia archaeon]